jgi:NAD(P)-dependent dehydrogenase (short-subunit alcohol dehydrogenase family)
MSALSNTGVSLDLLIHPQGLQSIRVTRAQGIATVRLLPKDGSLEAHKPARPHALFAQHKDVGEAVEWLSLDEETRVIVLTGTDRIFHVPSKPHAPAPISESPLPSSEDWALFEGLRRTLKSIISTDKPVIAAVNGDAVGYGSSLVFACDFIVASADVLIGDSHLGMGELPYGRQNHGVVPGDGGSVFVPMHMSPALSKEYLMLARTCPPAELATAGIINYAVPRDELGTKVDDLCERLTRRPKYALSWTKRHPQSIGRAEVQRYRGRHTMAYEIDIRDVGHIATTIERVASDFGAIDILVNNAGVTHRAGIMDPSEYDWDRINDINEKGSFFCLQNAARIMIPRRSGRIINISSIGGKGYINTANVAYAASKGAVISMTYTSAQQLGGPHNTNVNAICPGVTNTALSVATMTKLAEQQGLTFDELRARRAASIPIRRVNEPEDIAAVAVFLTSPGARNITGQTFNVDGGLIMQ